MVFQQILNYVEPFLSECVILLPFRVDRRLKEPVESPPAVGSVLEETPVTTKTAVEAMNRKGN
jgi:hypothetical protein